MVVEKKGQMQIQQMAFMIIAVFIFFVLVGLVFIGYQLKDVKSNVQELERTSAISSLSVIAGMPELSCDNGKGMCLDKDKLLIMNSLDFRSLYEDFWPVVSIEVRRIYPFEEENVECSLNLRDCNHYSIYYSPYSGEDFQKYSTYVSICERENYFGERCELGKLVVGVRNVK